MLTTAGLRRLADHGMTIGAHTRSHPILARLEPLEAKAEIADGRDWLESALRRPIRLFAYPNGKPGRDYGDLHVRFVRDLGFEAGFSSSWGAATPRCDPFQIPRFTPWDQTAFRYGLRLAGNMLRPPQLCT
jgi:peptidoglycan/xylan/chitin deacetylase (PgdA/CDA1 family)